MQDEASFLKDGDAATQKERFLAEEADLMKEADVEDKLVAKEKRREKRQAKKEREREVILQSSIVC
jgi:ATP-dependent RNA helicase DDX10/DBP4